MNKKYAIFEGRRYYPGGGWSDFLTTIEDLSDLRIFLPEYGKIYTAGGWYHVVNLEEGKVIAAGEYNDSAGKWEERDYYVDKDWNEVKF